MAAVLKGGAGTPFVENLFQNDPTKCCRVPEARWGSDIRVEDRIAMVRAREKKAQRGGSHKHRPKGRRSAIFFW
jgi:hypothetical protein